MLRDVLSGRHWRSTETWDACQAQVSARKTGSAFSGPLVLAERSIGDLRLLRKRPPGVSSCGPFRSTIPWFRRLSRRPQAIKIHCPHKKKQPTLGELLLLGGERGI